jgi:hypothetical protein
LEVTPRSEPDVEASTGDDEEEREDISDSNKGSPTIAEHKSETIVEEDADEEAEEAEETEEETENTTEHEITDGEATEESEVEKTEDENDEEVCPAPSFT